MAGNPRGECLLNRIGSTQKSIVLILAEGGHFRQVGTDDQQRTVVIGIENYGVHALIEAQVLLDLGNEAGAQLLVAAVHRQL